MRREAADDGEVPVGCVVAMEDGRIVGRGRNRREKGKSALAHAELEAIGEACRTLGGWRLWQCTLYVTLEPCCMCAGAITGAQIPRVVYGAADSKMGAGGSLVNLLCLPGMFPSRCYNRRSRRGVPGAFADLFPLATRKKENSSYANQREVRTLNYKITADSTCDLSPELLEQYGLSLTPLYVQLGEKTYRDGVDIFPDDIYAHVANGGDLATTAAVNLADYVRLFFDLSRKYDFVIHICISSDFSCCYQNASLAAAEYPNVYIVDSRNLSTGHGLVVLEAERCARKGMGPQAIVSYLQVLTEQVDASFILSRLEYMKKGGRCSSVAVLGANLLRLRPAIEVTDGKMHVCKKYRGTFEACVKAYIADRLQGKENLNLRRVFITHSGVPEEIIETAKEAVRQYQNFEEICVTRRVHLRLEPLAGPRHDRRFVPS